VYKNHLKLFSNFFEKEKVFFRKKKEKKIIIKGLFVDMEAKKYLKIKKR
jgi:hypothetical protein